MASGTEKMKENAQLRKGILKTGLFELPILEQKR